MIKKLKFISLLVSFTLALNAADKPLIVANYYTWYAAKDSPLGKWEHWGTPKASFVSKSGHNPENFSFPPYFRDIHSSDYPLIGPYSSNDEEVIRWHIKLAKEAGIDAFMVNSWGPGTWQAISGLTDFSTQAVAKIAKEENFKFCLFDETAQFCDNFELVKKWAVEYLERYKDYPNYFKIDGKPVYYMYQVSFAPRLSQELLKELTEHIEKHIGKIFLIVDSCANPGNSLQIVKGWEKNPNIDCFAFYGTFSIFREHDYERLFKRYSSIVAQAHANGKKMMVPVHPGHNNRKLREDDYYIIPRENGKTFRDFLSAAKNSKADIIMITSWNEWPESTTIEPAANWDDPYLYLKIIAEFQGKKFLTPPEPKRIVFRRSTP